MGGRKGTLHAPRCECVKRLQRDASMGWPTSQRRNAPPPDPVLEQLKVAEREYESRRAEWERDAAELAGARSELDQLRLQNAELGQRLLASREVVLRTEQRAAALA